MTSTPLSDLADNLRLPGTRIPVVAKDDITPLTFVKRYRCHSTPVVIKGMVAHWPAVKKWTWQYLLNTFPASKKVNVSLTPTGRADAINPETGVFETPAEVPMTLAELKECLAKAQTRARLVIPYAQHQNNSFEKDFPELWPDIDDTLHKFGADVFCDDEEPSVPDATNMWIGGGLSVSSMHQDWYENLYAVVRGTKRFKLVAPWECAAVPKVVAPTSEYEYNTRTEEFRLVPTGGTTPWISVDPAQLEATGAAHVYHVEVCAGDVLYLPPMWFHEVSQCGDGDDPGKNISINTWFDMNFNTPLFHLQQYIKDTMIAGAADRLEGAEEGVLM
eukprot:PhM_4_TR3576/c0_g1_i1/m.50631/K19219/JMJD7; jumonji domain-containing protein 7